MLIVSKKILFLIAILLPSIIVVPVIPATNATTPIKVGIFAPYPSLSALSLYGAATIQGFQLGLIYSTGGTNKTLGGRPYQLYYYDTKSDPTTATTVATNAIENDGIDILVGGTSSAVAAALQTVAAKYHKLYFITPGADSSLTGSNFNIYSFRLARNSYQDAITGIDYAWDSTGARKFAIIAPGYSFGISGAQAMQQEITKKGGVTVDTVYVPLGTTDFTPYMNRLINDNNTLGGIDMLMVIWAGAGFNYLYAGLADNHISNYMNISSGVIDTASMDAIQASMTTGTLIGQTGLAVYGYKLANNAVNTWMVDQSIARKITPDAGYPGSSASIYGMDFSKLYIPELFTPDGFSTAEFLVNITNKVSDLNVNNMICGLENMTLATPKGMERIRPQDHQGLPEMYIATIVNDTNPSSPSYWSLIGKLVQTLSPEQVAPPIETTYNGCSPSSTTASSPGFELPTVIMGLTLVVLVISVRKRKN